MSYFLGLAVVAVISLLAGVAVSDEVKNLLRWAARVLGLAPGDEVQPSRPAVSWAEVMDDRLPLTGQAIHCEKAPGRAPWELESRAIATGEPEARRG